MSSSQQFAITAVICTYNRAVFFEKALQSLLQQSLRLEKSYEILVIDNSSDPEVLQSNHALCQTMLREIEQEKQCHSIALCYVHETETGLSRARNRALKDAQSELIAYLDDDAVAYEGWLKAYVDLFERHSLKLAAAGGRVDADWGAKVPAFVGGSAYAHVEDLNGLEFENHKRLLFGVYSVLNWGGETRALEAYEWIAGCNICFRRSALKDVGGFPLYLGRKGNGAALMNNEESEALAQLRNLGYAILYHPEARVRHHVPKERLDQSWVIRRNGWQVVSDMVQQGSHYSPPVEADRARVRDFLAHHKEDWQALLRRYDDPVEFDRHMFACIALVRLILSGNMASAMFDETIDQSSDKP